MMQDRWQALIMFVTGATPGAELSDARLKLSSGQRALKLSGITVGTKTIPPDPFVSSTTPHPNWSRKMDAHPKPDSAGGFWVFMLKLLTFKREVP